MLYIFAYIYIKLIPPTGSLKEIYLEYRNNKLSKEELTLAIEQFCNEHALEISQLIDESIMLKGQLLHNEMKKNIVRKMCRMKVLEETKHLLPDEDLNDNIKTAQKSAVYMYYRGLYNDISLLSTNKELQCALFFFIRNYCYSGMFRYNDKGEFNVPYGGIAYNNKTLDKKISYYHSTALINHFAQCSIDNLDFEDFLNKHQPEENDFIFIDPPYDSDFSTYAQNEFTRVDQKRLANYLINECQAKWMVIIKHTDFIYELYNKSSIKIRTFDKEYLVSFMNRNNKKATHLMITNY